MWKEIHPRPQEKENLKFSSIIFSDVNYFVVVFSFFFVSTPRMVWVERRHVTRNLILEVIFYRMHWILFCKTFFCFLFWLIWIEKNPQLDGDTFRTLVYHSSTKRSFAIKSSFFCLFISLQNLKPPLRCLNDFNCFQISPQTSVFFFFELFIDLDFY